MSLVLIHKGYGDAEAPSTYRPLCMLDIAGKLLKKLIKTKLRSGCLSGPSSETG